MASRKRGSVRVRGNSISVVLDLGEQPWRRCPTPRCSGSTFTDSRALLACERCGAALEDPVPQRRRVWHSGFKTKAQANRKLTELLGQVDTGGFIEPTTITLRQFIDNTWRPGIEASDLRPATKDALLRSVRLYSLPHLGHVRLRDLTPAVLVQWIAGLKTAGVGARTTELACTTMHKVLQSACDLELLPRNPAANRAVRDARPRAKPSAPTVWTAQQTAQFLDSQRDDRLYALWRLAVATGMRRGELAGLRWQDLDLDTGTVQIAVTRTVVGHAVVNSDPKTQNSRRVLGLDAGTVAALRSWRKRQLEERMAWGPAWTDTGLVFTKEDGTGHHPARLTRMLAARATAAGLPPVRLHALRHGHATHGLESGVPLPVISKRLGHASIRITADTYQHVTAAVDQAAADAVAALYDSATL